MCSTGKMNRSGNASYGFQHQGINMSAVGGNFSGFHIHSFHSPVAETIEKVILPIVCACGIIGIIFTVIVLSRKIMCTSTNCYLIALAIADLIFLILLSTKLLGSQIKFNEKQAMKFQIYGIYAVIFMNVFLLSSVWVTVILALERYIAICRPFLATKMCTVKRARIAIVCIFVFAFLCRLVNFWEHRIVTMSDTYTNETVTFPETSQLSLNRHYTHFYPWVVDVFMVSVVPFVLLLLLNARLIWEVRKSTRYVQRNMIVGSKSNHSIQREEVQITVMLISVVVVFFICQAPYVIYNTLMSITQYRVHGLGYKIFQQVAILLLTLKSAINFLLYCWFSEKFWATFKRTFCVGYGRSGNGPYNDLRRMSNCHTRDTSI